MTPITDYNDISDMGGWDSLEPVVVEVLYLNTQEFYFKIHTVYLDFRHIRKFPDPTFMCHSHTRPAAWAGPLFTH